MLTRVPQSRSSTRPVRAAVVVALFLAAAHASAQAALPPGLQQIRCQTDAGQVEGHDIVQVAGTQIALRCVNAGTMKNTEKAWKKETDKDAMAFDLLLKKTPAGHFVANHGVARTLSPKATEARYLAEARVRLHPFPPFSMPLDNRREFRVPTPAAFAPSGPEITFQCSFPVGNGQSCWAFLQSSALYWSLVVRFGWPYPKMPEIHAELTEALNLVALHIVKQ